MMARNRHKWDPICGPPTGLVRPVPIDPRGIRGPTRGRAYGPRWRLTTPGLFVPAHITDAVPEQRILEQSMRLRDGGAVTGWGSLRMNGGNFFDGLMTDRLTELPVDLCTGPLSQIRKAAGIALSRDRLLPAEVLVRHGVPCTRVLRATFDAMRKAPSLLEAVVVMDMVAAAELASISQMLAYVETRSGWEGVQQVRDALALADEDSRSPNETRMRFIWQINAGFPRPLVNRPVWDLNGTCWDTRTSSIP